MMMSMSHNVKAIAFAAFALCLGRGTRAAGADSPIASIKPSAEIERLLAWLPEDTEAVLVSKGQVPVGERTRLFPSATTSGEVGPLTRGHAFPSPFGDPPFRFEDMLAAACIQPLADISELFPVDCWSSMVKECFAAKTAVVFAKVMRPGPDGLPEACDLVVFRDNTPLRLVNALARFRHVERRIDDVRILEMDLNGTHVNDKGTSLARRRFVGSPLPGVYLAATSERLAGVLIRRMKERSNRLALPTSLPEWRQVDVNAPAWAIRHYARNVADKIGTSMVKWDPNARGLTLHCGNKPVPFAALRYVSSSTDAGQRFIDMRSHWLGVTPRVAKSIPPLPRINAETVEDRRVNPQEPNCVPVCLYLSLLGFGPHD